ncbi:hypothetical protein YV76_004614 [Salmonella enterica subsp. enterica]|nr:hypothetical protein [Salmonella enterica subsp. enterica]
MRKVKAEQHADYADIKARSRDRLVKEFGPRMEINLHKDSQERLLEIANWLNQDDYSELDRGKTNIFRKTIGDIINMTYLDYLYTPKSIESKMLYKLYERYDKLKYHLNLPQEKIKKILSEEFPVPRDIENGCLELKKTKWTNKQIRFLHDYRWIIQTMEKLDDISREQFKSACRKK